MKTYFIVYKMQRGQTIPAYSFVDEAIIAKIPKETIDWQTAVEPKAIRTPEEVEVLLGQYKEKK